MKFTSAMFKYLKFGFCVAVSFLFACVKTGAQNLETIQIQKEEFCSTVVPEQCYPEDMIIVINSSIKGLRFESNMLPDSDFTVIYYEESNQYIICHERIKFKLTVSGPNLQSKDIDIFDLEKPQVCFSITSNVVTGTVNILTNPRNSIVHFIKFDLYLSTNKPIVMVSGVYEVEIIKTQYLKVDTLIEIPRNAEKTYNIDLVPLFALIKLNLATGDTAKFLKAPVISIDSDEIILDSYVTPGKNQMSFFDDVVFLKFYEGNLIPLAKEGSYDIRIEAEGYNTFKTRVTVRDRKTTTLSVTLEPISGFVTFVDKQFSDGANIIMDNKRIGQVPMFKCSTRVGEHRVKFMKPGFRTIDPEYVIIVSENQNTDFDVIMFVAKSLKFESDPPNAEIFMDNKRIGFTSFSSIMNAGKHEFLAHKNGYATERFYKIIDDKTPDEETIRVKLRPNFPFDVRSEEDSLKIRFTGLNELSSILIDSTVRTPSSIGLPYGKYRVALLKGKNVVYKSTVNHTPEILQNGRLPVYSRSSFHVLSGSYQNMNNFEGTFGRVLVFPRSGLSTAILDVDYRYLTVDSNSVQHSYKTLAPYIFFLNWDWRIGGSIIRQLDINLVGRAKYTPGLKGLNLHIPDIKDVEMQNYFYGIEISTRLPYVNLCFRYGRQILKGKINNWDEKLAKYTDNVFSINKSCLVGTIGITISGKVYRSNNILRLWQKPLIDLGRRKVIPQGKKL
jgi:hypothetical protein